MLATFKISLIKHFLLLLLNELIAKPTSTTTSVHSTREQML